MEGGPEPISGPGSSKWRQLWGVRSFGRLSSFPFVSLVNSMLDVQSEYEMKDENQWEPTEDHLSHSGIVENDLMFRGVLNLGKPCYDTDPYGKPTSTMEGNKVSVRALAIFVVLVWIMATWRPDKLRFHEDSLGSNIGQHRWSHSSPTMQFWIAKMSLWNASHESFPLGGIISWGWVSQAIS